MDTVQTFFSQPISVIVMQSIGTLSFGLFVIGVLFWTSYSIKEHPIMWSIGTIAVVLYSIVSSNESIFKGTVIAAGVGIYGISALFTAIAAGMATPVFWLIIIAMLIASR